MHDVVLVGHSYAGFVIRGVLGDMPERLALRDFIPLEVKQTISRIAQEALHNVVKHARATSVALTLECTDEEVMFEVRDDGSGFDPIGDFAGHLGLRSMRERAASLGGRVEIESTPGAGSKIRLTIPINA